MADTPTVWIAGNDGTFDLAGNWDNGIPGVAADKLGIFDGTSQTSVSKNLDQSGAANAFKIRTTPDYLGDIGGPDNGLKINTDGGGAAYHAHIKGQGNTYIGIAAGSTLLLYVDNENGYCQIEGDAVTSNLSHFTALSGRILITEQVVMSTSCYIAGESTRVAVEPGLDSNYTPPGALWIDGGVTDWKRKVVSSVGGSHFGGGVFNMTGDLGGPVSVDGGVVNYLPKVAPVQLPQVIVRAGFFNAGDYARQLTFTDFIVFPRARFSGDIIISGLNLRADLNEEYP